MKGGTMLQEAYTFTLNETITFEEAHPLKEMLGIGLEPVLSVQELSDTVSIRGVMELKGEYVRNDVASEIDLSDGARVEHVESLSEEVCEFFHKFLMDITIPLERVDVTENISIDVDHFDYTILSPQALSLEAVVSIHGLKQEDIVIEQEQQNELTRFNDVIEELEESDTEQFEIIVEDDELKENEEQANDNVVVLERDIERDLAEHMELEENIEEIMEEVEEQEEKKEERLHVQGRTEVEEASYLLNIFSEEEETSYSRVKLYIVQPTDQLNVIAEKYNVTPRQIMRTNALEDEDISQGQIIYIPIHDE